MRAEDDRHARGALARDIPCRQIVRLPFAFQRPLQQLRRHEHELLNKYEWINLAAGVARIPVERAIEVISQNGLPAALNVPAATDASSMQEPISAGNNSPTAEENEP